jgi:outer membrane protein assembly factor BamB/thioredoxin-like negative regulator of GroEL
MGRLVPAILRAFGGNAPQPAADSAKPAAANNPNMPQPAPDAAKPAEADNPFAHGAALETDPDIDLYLHRAEDLVKGGNHRDAAVIFQHVLDNCGDLMVLAVSREPAGSPAGAPERIYRPLREHVERLLTAPKRRELLAAYRLTADPEAQGALDAAGMPSSEEALRQVVRRFFASARGDDAAYRLGCLLLDRYEFRSARSLFQKVLDEHPDPSVPRSDLLLRMAIACARTGDAQGAEKALAQLPAGSAARVAAAAVTQLRAEIVRGVSAPGVETSGWHMDLGTPARNGRMKPLTGELGQSAQFWSEAWQHQSVLQAAPSPVRVLVHDPFTGALQPQTAPARGQLVQRWRKNGWFPTGDILLDNDRVYIKSRSFRDPQAAGGSVPVAGLACLDATTGELLWLTREEVRANSANAVTAHTVFAGNAGVVGQERPTTAEEVEFFSDQLMRTLTMFDGVVYCLEGCAASPGSRAGHVIFNNRQAAWGGQSLAAVDAETGQVRWRVVGAPPRTPSPQNPMQMLEARPDDRFFLAAPLKAGAVLLVPAVRNQSLQLLALSPDDGRLVWEKPLCLEQSAAQRNSSVGLAIDGSETFVATGAGLVFALDATDGRVLWAARYQTDQPKDGAPPQRFFFGRYGTRPVEGWTRDVIIPCGGTLLVMPSDAKKILYFDRRTGDLRGLAEQGEAKYVLGVLGNRLLVAGNNLVACYSTQEPKRMWVADSAQGITGSAGRGALTEQMLYIPVADAIALLDPSSGKAIGRIRVDTGHRDPIGNLVCDGRNLVAYGMDRTYALSDGRVYLDRLAERIQRGDTDAMVARAGLRFRLGQAADALTDLRQAHQTSRADAKKQQAIADQLVDRLLTLARQQPNQPALLDEAGQLAQTHPQRVRVALARARRLADAGQADEAVPLLVALAGDPEGLLVALDGEDGNCRTLSSQAAAAELRRIISRDRPPAGTALRERVQAEMARLEPRLVELRTKPSAYAATLLRLARGLPGTELALEKTRAAAEHLRDQGSVELAENVLLQLEHSTHRPSAAAAMAARAELYERIGWTSDALETWQQLAEAWAGVTVLGRQGQTAEQLARQHLERLPKTAAEEAAAAGKTPAPPWKQLWSLNNIAELGVNRTSEPLSRFLDRHLLFISMQDRSLQCVDVATGQPSWTFTLSQNNMSMSRSGTRVLMFNGLQFPGGVLPRDGHVGILRAPNQTRALGLVSGKLLWPTPDSTPEPAATQGGFQQHFYGSPSSAGQITTLDVGAGVLAEVVSGDAGPNCSVRVRDLVTGKVCWEREFDDQPLQGVKVQGDFVTVAFQGSRELWVGDRATGAKLGRFTLDNSAMNRWTAFTDLGVLNCTADALVLRGLPDGRVVWTIPFAVVHMQRFDMPDGRTLCLVGRQGDGSARALVVDAVTGKIIATIPSEVVGISAMGLAMTRDRQQVHVMAYDGQGGYKMTIVDVATGKRLASFSLGRVYRQLQNDEPINGDLIPLLVSDPPIQLNANSFRSSNLHTVYFLRKSDGKVLKGLKLPVQRADGKIENAMAVTVRGQALLLYTGQGITAFGHDPAGAPPQVEAVDPASVMPQASMPGPAAAIAAPIAVPAQVQVQAVAEVAAERPAKLVPARPLVPLPAAPVAKPNAERK